MGERGNALHTENKSLENKKTKAKKHKNDTKFCLVIVIKIVDSTTYQMKMSRVLNFRLEYRHLSKGN